MMHDTLTLQDIADEQGMPLARVSRGHRIVVAGEFGAGKSSVINALLRQPILPCNPGFASRPLITIRHSEEKQILVEDAEGNYYRAASLDELVDHPNLASCHVHMPLPGMEDTEIIELPFHHDGGIDQRDLTTLADADLIIWVSIGSQAWRLSEKSIIERLPKQVRNKSVLAISRADKFRSAEDLDKIEARMQQEAAAFFTEIVFMQASTANLAGSASDDHLWEQSGGRALESIARDAFESRS